MQLIKVLNYLFQSVEERKTRAKRLKRRDKIPPVSWSEDGIVSMGGFATRETHKPFPRVVVPITRLHSTPYTQQPQYDTFKTPTHIPQFCSNPCSLALSHLVSFSTLQHLSGPLVLLSFSLQSVFFVRSFLPKVHKLTNAWLKRERERAYAIAFHYLNK